MKYFFSSAMVAFLICTIATNQANAGLIYDSNDEVIGFSEFQSGSWSFEANYCVQPCIANNILDIGEALSDSQMVSFTATIASALNAVPTSDVFEALFDVLYVLNFTNEQRMGELFTKWTAYAIDYDVPTKLWVGGKLASVFGEGNTVVPAFLGLSSALFWQTNVTQVSSPPIFALFTLGLLVLCARRVRQ